MATLPKAAKEKEPEVPIELRLVGKVFGLRQPSAHSGSKGVVPIKTTNDDLLCGIELEIENLREGHGYYEEYAGEFWAVEEDGSLRPRGEAWEFISAPAKMSQTLAEVAELFRKFGISEEKNYSDRCSVHIHTNVIDWTQQQLAVLGLIYPVFEGALFQFVNHYKKKEEQGYCRDTNLYCIPWSDCRHNRNFVENLFKNPGGVRHWQKYTALNVLPVTEKGTVEWRHMHGTCDMDKLTLWFNIIGAIMRYCANTPFDKAVSVIRAMNDVSTYQQFFEEVLLDSLPYNEEYRRLMAEGVVNAKYSLINWEANKGKPASEENAFFHIDDWPPPPPNFEAVVMEQQDNPPVPGALRFNNTAAAINNANQDAHLPNWAARWALDDIAGAARPQPAPAGAQPAINMRRQMEEARQRLREEARVRVVPQNPLRRR